MLADDIRHHLPELRQEVGSLMVDRAIISRGGEPVFNEETGEYTLPGTTIYDGPCQLRDPGIAEVTRTFGEQQVTAASQILALPHTAKGVKVGDVALVVTDDPQAANLRYRVVSMPATTWAVVNNFAVEVIL